MLRGLAVLLLGLVLTGPITPAAYACACGAMEPADRRDLGVNSETAAILFDGTTETIVLSMGLTTDSSQVAFLMPLPTRAEAGLAGAHLFDDLYDHTRPEQRVRYDYRPDWRPGVGGQAGAPPGGAVVVGRQRVGDYDVVQLTGEATAVGQWLAANGFRTRPEVLAGLDHYLSQGWVVLAATLVFDGEFSGEMAPLTLTFPTTTPIYPMLLSALADRRQTVRFYVLADHRQDVSLAGRQLDTTFAGWVDAATLRGAGRGDAAALLGERRWFLTRVDDEIDPARITTDLAFAPSREGDAEYRAVQWTTVDRGWVTVLAVAAGTVGVIGGTVAVAVVVHRRNRRAWQGEPSG